MWWGLTRPWVTRQAKGRIMSDTLFTAAPHWRWLIVLYFFIGGIAGGSFFLAALLDLFGRPQDRPIVRTGYYVAFLGAVVSGVLLMLLGLLRGARTRETVHWLCRMDRGTLLLELLALIILTASLGPVLRLWMNVWGLLLLVGVVLAGILLPLSLEWRPRLLGRLSLPVGAVLVLLGGFLLRVVVILSSEGV